MAAVNGNSSKIYNFQSDHVVLSGPDFPSLRASIVFERPLRLRLKAGTGVSGLELDLGSNDELFWVWVRRDPQMYFCRYVDLPQSALRQHFPLDPRWIVDALGLVEIDPRASHEGPQPVGGQQLRIVSRLADSGETWTRVLLIDAQTAVVHEQSLYDASGQLVASAKALRHRRDPLTGLVMPQVVHLTAPAFQLALQIDLGQVRINRPLQVTPDTWQMPHYEGWAPVDLARIALLPNPGWARSGQDAGRHRVSGIPARLVETPRPRIPFRR
jgi:hypothetical protein